MYTNYECYGYKFTLTEENTEDKLNEYRTYTLFKNGNYLKNVHISKTDVEDNFVARYKFHKIIEELKRKMKQQFPCDKWDKKQMTRNEAAKLVSQLSYDISTGNLFTGKGMPPEDQFLLVLEKLGLIKFEEEKKDIVQRAKECTIQYPGHPSTAIIKTLIEELEKRPKVGEDFCYFELGSNISHPKLNCVYYGKLIRKA